MRFLIGVLFISLVVMSCNRRNCSDESIGQIDFTDEARAWAETYTGETFALFVSNDGLDSLLFSVNVDNNSRARVCTKIICRPWDPFDANGCEVLEAEQVYYTLQAENIILHWKVLIEQMRAESDDVYEIVLPAVGAEFQHEEGGLILSNSFQDDALTLDEINLDPIPMEGVDDYSFNGAIIPEVYHYTSNGISAYVSRDYGFLEFTLEDKTYKLN